MRIRVLTISLARNILTKGSREYERMQLYVQQLSSYHIIILTRTEHHFTNDIHDGNLHIYPTNSTTRIGMLRDAYVIGKKILCEREDGATVITAQDPLEIGWLSFLLAHKTHTPLHIQVHGDYFSSNAWVGYSPYRYMKRGVARILLAHARGIRVVSVRIAESLVRAGISRSRITVLPIRPEIETFLAHTPPTRVSGAFTFLYVGRLSKEKNIPRILNAFLLLVEKYPNTQMRIVGKGPLEHFARTFIKRKNLINTVTVIPWTEDVPAEMARADIFLLASKHEAYALTLIEALASGVPVVTTDVGCVGELVIDGVHGLVVRERGAQSYMHAMESLMNDGALRSRCAENGKALAQELAKTSATAYATAWVHALKKIT